MIKNVHLCISILVTFLLLASSNVFANSKENTLLLALKIECSANKAGGNAWKSNFFGVTTEHTFHASRWWYGSGDRLGDIGQHTFNGTKTVKSLIIKGEGRWLKDKSKKPWKLQFLSKGDNMMINHLEAGVEGFEGEGRYRRDCTITLLNKVKAHDAIQLDSYTRVISGLKNQIDNLKKEQADKENNQDEITEINEEFKQKINNLENIIASLQKEKEISQNKIKELNDEVIETKNNTEFKTKYEELNKELDKVNKELANNEEQLTKNENKLRVYQEKEQAEIKRKEKEEEAKRIAIKLEEEKQIEEEKKKEERKIKNLKYELGASELVIAQNLINDLQEFIQNNPEEFDIVDIAELLIENKGIIDGEWEENSQAYYNKLSDFINKSDAFTSYNQSKEDERFALAMDQLNNEYELLVAKQNELEKLLNDNLTSEFASEIIDKVKFVRTTLEDYSLKELIDSNVIIEEFFIQILNKISEKELEIANKKDEIKRFDSNYKNLELLLSQNLTSENSPFIIEKINAVKNLQTGNLNSTDLSIINVELEVFIEKVENNTLIPKKEEKKVVQNNLIKKNTSDQKFETEEKRESFVGGSNAISDFINDVKLGMQTNFNELTCEDVFNQVKGLQLKTAFGGSFDMIFFDEVILLEKNKDEIICESYITLSNNNKSWYDMKIYKKDGNIFYEVEPKTSSTKRTNIKPVSSNTINEEKLVIPSFDKLIKEKKREFREPFFACITDLAFSEEDVFNQEATILIDTIVGNQTAQANLTVEEFFTIEKNDPNIPKIGECYGFVPLYGMYGGGYVRGDGQNYIGSVKLLKTEFDVDQEIVEPIFKDTLTVTEYFDQNTIYQSKIVNMSGKISEIKKTNSGARLDLFSEKYKKTEYSLSAYIDSDLWEKNKNYFELVKSLEVGDEISIKGMFESGMWGIPKIDIIKIHSINELDISETKNKQTNNFKNKVVFSILDATDVVKSIDEKDDFGKFTHYRNLVGCEYTFKIDNNTNYPVKINTFEIRTNNKKLFSDSWYGKAYIQINQVVEPGNNYNYNDQVDVWGGQYSRGGPRIKVENTKDLPTDQQVKIWKEKYGCDAQKGSIFLHQGNKKGNVVFPEESGITPDKINDYIIGSPNGLMPLIEEIDFE